MRRTAMRAAVVALLLMSLGSQAGAQTGTAQPTKPFTVCEALAHDWRSVEMDMAENHVDGMGDDSAPRATLRAIQEQNSLQTAAITLQLMRDNKCEIPKRAPNYTTYELNALDCAAERAKGNNDAPQCKRDNWKGGL